MLNIKLHNEYMKSVPLFRNIFLCNKADKKNKNKMLATNESFVNSLNQSPINSYKKKKKNNLNIEILECCFGLTVETLF